MNTRARAFTIIELVITLVIIAVLAAVAAVSYNALTSSAELTGKEVEATQAAKVLQANSASTQVPVQDLDSARDPAGSQVPFSQLPYGADLPLGVSAVAVYSGNLSVVFSDGLVCSGVSFSPEPGSDYQGEFSCAPAAPPDRISSPTVTSGDQSLLVSWSPSGEGVLEYTATTNPGGFSCTVPAPDSSCSITGLTNGQEYAVSVTSRTVTSSSDPSQASIPLAPSSPPSQPTLVGVNPSVGGLIVTWLAPSSDGGAPVSYYTATSTSGDSCTVSAPSTLCEITALPPASSHQVSVVAYNAAGASAVSALSASYSPLTLPSPPTLVNASADVNSLVVGWAPPRSSGSDVITSYTATTNTGASCTVPAPTPSCTIPGLSYATAYTVTVTATSNAGTSDPSERSLLTNPLPPFNNAVGGVVTEVEDYLGTGQTWRVHTFTSPGSFEVLSAPASFRVLVVGGGGAAGPTASSRGGGGGGGGGVFDQSGVTLPVGNYPVSPGAATQPSSFHTFFAAPGASGRGGWSCGVGPLCGRGGASGAPTSNPGGAQSSDTWNAGGGAGAGGAGSPGGSCSPGPCGGGQGLASNVTGNTVYYGAGGGGGRMNQNGQPGKGNGASTAGVVVIAYRVF